MLLMARSKITGKKISRSTANTLKTSCSMTSNPEIVALIDKVVLA